MEGFITEIEAAAMLDLSVYGVRARRWRKSKNALPYYKHGKKIYYKKQDIIEYLESKRVALN